MSLHRPVNDMNLDFSTDNSERYRHVAWQAARRTGLEPDSCEDVAQEALIQLYKNQGNIFSEKAVWNWLKTAARRLAVTKLQAHARISPLTDVWDGVDTEEAVIAQIDRERELAVIERALLRLMPKQRMLLYAIYGNDMSYAETSESLGMPFGSIGPTRNRAMERLTVACREDLVMVA